ALPGAVFVSARTGDGIDALRRRMAELAAPTDTAVDVVIPYDRGDLVSRVHADGRVQETEHISDGTRIKAPEPPAPPVRSARMVPRSVASTPKPQFRSLKLPRSVVNDPGNRVSPGSPR